MTDEIRIKVNQLKNSFAVEGCPLIKSDRFTDEEIAKMKAHNDAHPSHWNHLAKGSKVWSDDEIAAQIETFMSLPVIDDRKKIESMIENLFYKCPFLNKKSEKEQFIVELNQLFGLEGHTPFNLDFWAKFGSAPYQISKDHHNEDLDKAKKLYGACGMIEIFGSEAKFSGGTDIMYTVFNWTREFDKKWDDARSKKVLSEQVFISPFKTLDELEENTIVKQVEKEARIFYHDKTKSMGDRIKTFCKYGKKDPYIFNPTNSDLCKIFDMFSEKDSVERHQEIETPYIISWWIEILNSNRTKLDWTNPYHPKLKKTQRNYKPSKAAIERLYKYYIEKLFLEEVGSFVFDW